MSTDNNSTELQKQSREIELFNTFIKEFVIDRKSLIDENTSFEDGDIETCLSLIEDTEVMNSSKEGKKSLGDKLMEKETSSHEYQLLWHCYYIMYMMGETAKSFFNINIDNDLLFVTKGTEVASTNQAYNKEAIRPFRFLLQIFKELWQSKRLTGEDNVKSLLIEWLPKNSLLKTNNLNINVFDSRVKNILLYLCEPNTYIPIVSQDHKNSIWNNLYFLINKKSEDDEGYNEACFKTILKQFQKEKGKSGPDSFYDKTIRPFWERPSLSTQTNRDGELPLKTLLLFKKAIVLYGPPGTSKTYTARELAKEVISAEFVKFLQDQKKEKPEDYTNKLATFINNEDVIFGNSQESNDCLSHIHRLQLHPNYTYDDFIAGKTISVKDGSTTVEIQKGYLMKLIDTITDDRKKGTSFSTLPHILILDEINRVDISRVFGELFTAMESEYRIEGVDLPLTDNNKPLKLIVPEDLYLIGTMNMIDFSLEQVDFALRRRFAWVESNYDEGRLKEIIYSNDNSNGFDVEMYSRACTKLNDKISNQPNLGPTYKIGHTFFAEICDIQKSINGNSWTKAREFLWIISIKPMIEAYCGTMDSKAQKEFIDSCKKAYLND